MSESKVCRALLSNLADLNNILVWVVSILPQISNSSSLFSKHLEAVPSAPTSTGTTFTLMPNIFFVLCQDPIIIIIIIVIIIIIYSFENFSHQRYLMVFHWSLSDSKSQVSRTLLSILADLNNAAVLSSDF